MSYIYTHGSGTAEDPYQIWTANDLDGVRDHLGSSFIQMADIDLSGWDWEPIGSPGNPYLGTQDNPFTGKIDGNNFNISNLSCKIQTQPVGYIKQAGLIGMAEMATLVNISLINVDIINNFGSVGALVNTVGAGVLIENCKVNGRIEGCGGGLVASVDNIWSNIQKTTLIHNCSAFCDIQGDGEIGGLIGSVSSNQPPYSVKISNCYAIGDIHSDGSYIGGFISHIDGHIEITDCYSISNVAGDSFVGGFIGHYSQENGLIKNCYSVGKVIHQTLDSHYYGGFIGFSGGVVNPINCYYNSDIAGCTDDYKGEPRTTVEMTYPYLDPENIYADWDFHKVWVHDKPTSKYPIRQTLRGGQFIIDTCLVYGADRAFCEYRYLAHILLQKTYFDNETLMFGGYDVTQHIKNIDSKIYLPVRVIAQDLLKLKVDWDEGSQQVHITGNVSGPINDGYPHFISGMELVYRILKPIAGGVVTYL
jgi:hypothetical protein